MDKDSKDEVIPLTPAQKVQADIIRALCAPRVHGCFMVDVAAVERFLEDFNQKHQARVSLNTAYIKAAALTLKKYPTIRLMPRGYKMVKSDSVDIGVSVAGEESLAPVIVIQNAESKSLLEISEEVYTKASAARRQEKEFMEKVSKIARWFPFDAIRRRLTRWVLTSQRLRRQVSGTFQISDLGWFGIEWACTPVIATTLLMIGSREKRPVVIEDRIEIRPTIYVVITGDHYILNGKSAGEFLNEFRRILQNPNELLQGA
jgi:pyruvate/2-oxoglutarate dehydrogenase complex dihydrolipoamide acyltransferase (E2) component